MGEEMMVVHAFLSTGGRRASALVHLGRTEEGGGGVSGSYAQDVQISGKDWLDWGRISGTRQQRLPQNQMEAQAQTEETKESESEVERVKGIKI